jgi:hypothetical protein
MRARWSWKKKRLERNQNFQMCPFTSSRSKKQAMPPDPRWQRRACMQCNHRLITSLGRLGEEDARPASIHHARLQLGLAAAGLRLGRARSLSAQPQYYVGATWLWLHAQGCTTRSAHENLRSSAQRRQGSLFDHPRAGHEKLTCVCVLVSHSRASVCSVRHGEWHHRPGAQPPKARTRRAREDSPSENAPRSIHRPFPRRPIFMKTSQGHWCWLVYQSERGCSPTWRSQIGEDEIWSGRTDRDTASTRPRTPLDRPRSRRRRRYGGRRRVSGHQGPRHHPRSSTKPRRPYSTAIGTSSQVRWPKQPTSSAPTVYTALLLQTSIYFNIRFSARNE